MWELRHRGPRLRPCTLHKQGPARSAASGRCASRVLKAFSGSSRRTRASTASAPSPHAPSACGESTRDPEERGRARRWPRRWDCFELAKSSKSFANSAEIQVETLDFLMLHKTDPHLLGMEFRTKMWRPCNPRAASIPSKHPRRIPRPPWQPRTGGAPRGPRRTHGAPHEETGAGTEKGAPGAHRCSAPTNPTTVPAA